MGAGQGEPATPAGETEQPIVDRAAEMSWLLQFTADDPRSAEGDGRPWGDGTAMAARAYNQTDPWDNGCKVTPFVGGFLAMNAMRDAYEAAIADAEGQSARPGSRGHVYIADWQFNALRDLSTSNPWGGAPWNPATTVAKDQTALGLVLRMMAAGIAVRLLLWMPTTVQSETMGALAAEHWNVAAAIQDYSETLHQKLLPSQPLGMVALDLRISAAWTAALHQKMSAIRVGKVNVGFCGGVDLAFTRRDFGLTAGKSVGIGDWQSGDTAPLSGAGWPKQSPPPIGGYPDFPWKAQARFPEDLPADVYGPGNRHWHDHHLQLEGPIVASIEQQFAERWVMDCNNRAFVFDRNAWEVGRYDQVQITSPAAINTDKTVKPLPAANPVAPAGSATVQMWRTIPLRPGISRGPFVRGEFTVMAGIANAVRQASQMITIWDQYFWSVPLAKLLADQMLQQPDLRLLIVLPPYGTTQPGCELWLRMEAMQALWKGLDESGRQRVTALDMWNPQSNYGVYVHAKAQTYDTQLLVCGSANMNRRSHQCDAELDCAVLHPPTVEAHLGNLYAALTNGSPWTDFGADWPVRFIKGLGTNSRGTLVRDPFFAGSAPVNPKTPNGVAMPTSCSYPISMFEPTSIGSNVEGSVCNASSSHGDPKAPGRLDEVTFLLERCHSGTTWPFRVPAKSLAEEGEEPPPMPRLTL